MKASLLAYWNGSCVQSCIELVYKIGNIEHKARTFLPKEEVEKVLNINLDDQIVETTIDVVAGHHSNSYGFKESFVLLPLAYNGWTTQPLTVICWESDIQ